jgi:hypothetical protein
LDGSDTRIESADRFGVGNEAVSQHADGHGFYIVGQHEDSSCDHSMRSSCSHQTYRSARTGSQPNERVDPACAHDTDGIGGDRGSYRYLPNGLLGVLEVVRCAHR